ncbi:MAG TPA: hypothetical protein VGA28_11025 [Desulfurivibrionaceae bacterium]|jgi:hypothetical protein
MFNDLKNIIHHIVITALSATIALSLPYTGKFIADNYLVYWARIESEKVFLISMEIAVAVLLIIFFNFLGKSWKDRKFSEMAQKDMGLVLVAHTDNLQTRKKIQQLKDQHGQAKDALIIGSTGGNTFVNPEGDLHRVLQNCREAKIILLNPFSEGAFTRAKCIPDPDITLEHFKEQLTKSIDFLKSLNSPQRIIRLKLYEETPLFKLAVLGDYVFMKYYHADVHIKEMPEYIFKHSPNHGNLFHPFYQIFLSKWRDSNLPEYDFETDELVRRDASGKEIIRVKFSELTFTSSSAGEEGSKTTGS